MRQPIPITEFEKQYLITDKNAIRTALGLSETIPNEFLPIQLIPIGCGKYKGDILPDNWSNNKFLEIGKTYPIYLFEGQRFVIGSDGKGLKFTVLNWQEIEWF